MAMEPNPTAARSAPDSPLDGIRIGRILGIPVTIHWSLALIFGLVLLNLGLSVLPAWHPGWSSPVTWATALGAAILFVISILCHELSHSLVAERQGVGIVRITLYLFGGVSEMRDEPSSPRSEFVIAVVGPLTSIGIGLLATLAGVAGSDVESVGGLSELGVTVRTLNPVQTLLLWLGPINLILGAFNLVPGFPLDGGRVFRAASWWLTGDVVKATRWAAGAGQALGWMLMFVGFMYLFAGSVGQGLWLILIGWFLINAAGANYQHVVLARALRDVKVTDLLQPVDTIRPESPVQILVDEQLMRHQQPNYPVVIDSRMVGLVGLEHVQKVERNRWPWTRVETIMTPIEQLPTLDGTTTAARAARTLVERSVTEIPILEDDRFVGLLRQQDIIRWIALHPEDHANR